MTQKEKKKLIHALHVREKSCAGFSTLIFVAYENRCLLQVKIPIFFVVWKVKQGDKNHARQVHVAGSTQEKTTVKF